MNEIHKNSEEPLRSVRCGLCIIFSALLSACASRTLFQSNFDATPIGQPPAHMQQVGTANVSGPPGSVVVVASPVQTGGRWVQVSRPADPVNIVAFQGNFSQFAGDGSYTFDATLFVPPDPNGRTVACSLSSSTSRRITALTAFCISTFCQMAPSASTTTLPSAHFPTISRSLCKSH
jgi:hypothetical protein